MKKALLLLLMFLGCATTTAQTSYLLMPVPHQQFLSNTGVLMTGGFLCTYASGTTTPLAAYSDTSGTTLPNPIRLNSAGRPQTGSSGAGTETGVYLSPSAYKINLYAAGTGNTCNGTTVGALIWSQDKIISGSLLGSTVQTLSFVATPTFDTSLAGIFILTLTGNVTSSTLSNARVGAIIQMTIKQDGVGSHTFAWPANVLYPPTISAVASSSTESAFYYDGTNWVPLGLNGVGTANQLTYFGSSGAVQGDSLINRSSTALILGAAGSTAGKLSLDSAGAGVVTLSTSPGTATYTMTMPPTAGTAGAFLQTDGTGITTFVSISSLAPVTFTPGLRLTTESGVPVSTTNRTAQGTLYYTPYVSNLIPAYSGTAWGTYAISQQSLTLTLTSGKNYDVFDCLSGSTLTLTLSAAWASDTARTDALGTQDGVQVKNADHSCLWVGTIRASGANQTADSGGDTTTQVGGQRFVWNYYNQVARYERVFDSTSTWPYTTQTIRSANGAAGNKNEYVTGLASTLVTATLVANIDVDSNVTFAASAGIGVDVTNAFSGNTGSAFNAAVTGTFVSLPANYSGYPGLGYHFISWNEYGADGGSIFRGAFNQTHSGLTVHFLN